MKRLLIILAFFALPVMASSRDHREVLLTPDGTLFVAERLYSRDLPEVPSASVSLIRVTVRNGENLFETIVPATLGSGTHADPALAYDAGSQTLFVFWQRSISLMHSELWFQALGANDLQWREASSFGSSISMRENLRIAVTRKAEELLAEGDTALVPQINVHAVWWETDTYDGLQSAQYAMLSIEDGAVVETTVQSMAAFLGIEENDASADVTEFQVEEVLKHPVLFPSTQQDSVLVAYANVLTGNMDRIRIRPVKRVGHARIHIPIGRAEQPVGAPRLATNAEANVEAIGVGDDRMAIYTSDETTLRYVLLMNGQWSAAREIRLDGAINREAAVNAVRHVLEH